MTRRAAPAALTAAACLLLLPLTGCRESSKPPLQTFKDKPTAGQAPPKDETVEPPTAEEKKVADERLDRAIIAHGGPVRLQKLRSQVQVMKGRIRTGRFGLVPADQNFKLQLPDRLRLRVDATTPEGPMHITIAIDRQIAWMEDAAGVKDLPAEVAESLVEEMYVRRVQTLAPLRDPEFVVRPVDGEPVGGRPTIGLRVGSKGHYAVNLYFDTETGLLVRTFGWFNEAGTTQLREMVLSDHKTFDGVKLPGRVVDIRDGTRWVDCTVEYQFPAAIDPKEFARP